MFSNKFGLIIIFNLVIFSPAISTPNATALQLQGLVWSDDFDDGNLEGWIKQSGATGGSVMDGCNCTVRDGMLEIDESGFAYLSKESNLRHGTWSLDVFAFNNSFYFGIDLLTGGLRTGSEIISTDFLSFAIFFDEITVGGSRYTLESQKGGVHDELAAFYVNEIVDEQWRHIDITYSESGQIAAYVNGSVVVSASSDKEINSKYSAVWTWGSHVLVDNVELHDTVLIDKIKPRFITYPEDMEIRSGQYFSYQVDAVDEGSGIASYSLNNTALFQIDDTGLITNKEKLKPGIYGIEVTITDNTGNSVSNSFTLTVKSNALLFTLIGGGVILAIVLVMKWKRVF